jgi:hypothetical protein
MKASTNTHGQEHDNHHQAIPSDLALGVKALESLIDAYENKIGPRNGAYYSVNAIPQDWIERLALRELISEKATALFDFSNHNA